MSQIIFFLCIQFDWMYLKLSLHKYIVNKVTGFPYMNDIASATIV